MRRCIIFCSGVMDTDAVWKEEYKNDFVLCADGGYLHAKRIGIVPDMIIVDLDSGLDHYPKEITHCIYPSEKDKTDTNLCLDYAIDNGYREVILFGAFGGRLDHEFSHYALMQYALQRGVRVRLLSGKHEIWMENEPFVLYPDEKKYISFFPYGGDVDGFQIQGLKYELSPTRLCCDMVQATSNQFDGAPRADISFAPGGTVLVMRCAE